MTCTNLVFLFVCLITAATIISAQETYVVSCKYLEEETISIHPGWPLILDCLDIERHRRRVDIDEGHYRPSFRRTECTISDWNLRLELYTYNTSSMFDENNYKYIVASSNQGRKIYTIRTFDLDSSERLKCYIKNYRVHTKINRSVPKTCSEFNTEDIPTDTVEAVQSLSEGSRWAHLNCRTPAARKLLDSGLEVNVEWYNAEDCENPVSADHVLKVESTVEAAKTKYICALEYMGMREYIIKYDLCLKPEGPHREIIAECPQEPIYARVGQILDIFIPLTTYSPDFIRGYLKSSWRNENYYGKKCSGYESSFSTDSNSQHMECGIKFLSWPTCHKFFPTAVLTKEVTRIRDRLQIRNVTESDFGNYTYKMHIVGLQQSRESHTCNFQVVKQA